jgi:hypothetical protein
MGEKIFSGHIESGIAIELSLDVLMEYRLTCVCLDDGSKLDGIKGELLLDGGAEYR